MCVCVKAGAAVSVVSVERAMTDQHRLAWDQRARGVWKVWRVWKPRSN